MRLGCLAALAGALIVFRAVPAGAASSSRIAVDARVELLGVVQYLSGERPDPVLDKAYQGDVERRFGPLRRHAAVRLYRQAGRRPIGANLGIILLYFSEPPALKLVRGGPELPYVEAEEDKVLVQRFIWELRDFAAVAGFSSFFAEHRAFYQKIERAAAGELGPLDPAAVIERYLRVSLDCRNNYILAPLYKVRANSFILPYPDPATLLDRPAAPFEVYTLFTWVSKKSARVGVDYSVFDVPSYMLWHEPLYVFIDPSFHHYEARYVPEPAKFYGEADGCRTNAANCLKGYVVAALSDRLSRRAWNSGLQAPAALGAYPAAISTRLEEYEAGQGTLWEFYPRLFSVFGELAHSSAPARASAVPLLPAVSVSDFFDRRWRRAFMAAP